MPQRRQTDRQPHDCPEAGDPLNPADATGKRRVVRDKRHVHHGVLAPLSDQEIRLDLLPTEPPPQRWANDEQVDHGPH